MSIVKEFPVCPFEGSAVSQIKDPTTSYFMHWIRIYNCKSCMHAYMYVYTIVWKIFACNYFVVENVQENNFCGLPIPMKIF